MSFYRYESLPSSSSFRILELLPGEREDEIAYRLHVADWNGPPSYEAISYAWGDTNVKTSTLCEGRNHEVTPNLRDGLRQMRYQDRSRYLWADAACIDQANMNERQHQVSNMRLIYQNATKVLVWLGEDENFQATEALKLMNAIVSICCQSADIPIANLKTVDDHWDIIPDHSVDDSDQSAGWQSVAWLLSRPWFSRLWVYQEVNSDTEVDMLCGSTILNWDTVTLVATYVYAYPDIHRRWGFLDSYYINAYTLRNRALHTELGLSELLHGTRSFIASNPLDRIYALMGLPPFVKFNPPFEVDYLKSTKELYTEIAARCILELESFQVLECLEHATNIGIIFPSWVPQWADVRHRNRIDIKRQRMWNAGAGKPLAVKINRSESILNATGIIVDSIVAINDLQYLQQPDLAQEDLGDSAPIRFWRAQSEQLTLYVTGEPSIEAYAMVLAAGNTYSGQKAIEYRAKFMASFLAYILRLSEISGQDPDFVLPSVEQVVPGDWSEFTEIASGFCLNRLLFTTSKGYMGIGDDIIQAGDIVCVLYGGDHPFILREVDGHYLILGEAYVHGIMEGEVVGNPEFKENNFEIH